MLGSAPPLCRQDVASMPVEPTPQAEAVPPADAATEQPAQACPARHVCADVVSARGVCEVSTVQIVQ